VRIATVACADTRSGKCSLLIDPDTDRAGLLYDLLGVFARRKINLTRIESRPSKKGIGKYVFFLDYAVNECTDEALRELREITTIRNLGCYPKIEVPI
jgi:prephenate dehydratase